MNEMYMICVAMLPSKVLCGSKSEHTTSHDTSSRSQGVGLLH
jgi:hypothetical protein